MSTAVSAVVERQAAQAGKPGITYRYAGDRALLVEYGEMEFDLKLNFFVLAVQHGLRENPIEGLIEAAPGFRSILVSYDPLRLATGDLLDHLHAVHGELQAEREMQIPSRLIHLPIALILLVAAFQK